MQGGGRWPLCESCFFEPVHDPDQLPGVIDLNLVFKGAYPQKTEVDVYQASTQAWHSFYVGENSTDVRISNVVSEGGIVKEAIRVDLTGIFAVPADLDLVEVRYSLPAAMCWSVAVCTWRTWWAIQHWT